MPNNPIRKPEIPTWRGHYAGFASRLVALIIDLLILAVALAITFMLYEELFANLANFSQLLLGRPLVENTSISILVSVLIVFFTFAIYFIVLWTVIGSTIGGVIIGIKIVNSKGKNPSVFQSTIRFILEFGLIIVGIIGAIWILFSRRRRALFDRVAGTFVIYAWDAKPDEKFLRPATDKLKERMKKPSSQ